MRQYDFLVFFFKKKLSKEQKIHSHIFFNFRIEVILFWKVKISIRNSKKILMFLVSGKKKQKNENYFNFFLCAGIFDDF